MELYSKEELLKELKKEYSCGGECDHCPEVLDAGSCSVLRCIRRIIDNALPVKFSLMPADETKEDAYKRGYERGKIAGILEANTRPQGEWGKWIISEIQCPKCFEYFETAYYSTEELKKCPNCGEDMRNEESPQAEEVSDRYDEGFRDGYAQCINDKEERKENNRLFQKGGTEKVIIKSTKDLINNIAGFDVSGIKPLPEYKDEITDAEQKGGAENDFKH